MPMLRGSSETCPGKFREELPAMVALQVPGPKRHDVGPGVGWQKLAVSGKIGGGRHIIVFFNAWRGAP